MNDTQNLIKPILVADIGGTNANFGIVLFKDNRYILLDSYQFPSQKITDFTQTVYELLETIAQEKHLRFSTLVVGIAGAICGNQYAVIPTNLSCVIDKSSLHTVTGIPEIFFINDFISVACGYAWVNEPVVINKSPIKEHSQKAFIGAGTGLGQSYAVWSRPLESYIPVATEGGHADFVAHDSFDTELQHFIEEKQLLSVPVTWEHVLSGKGISLIYEFLGTQLSYQETAISREIAHGRFQPDFISRYSEHDERCRQTFKKYAHYYAAYAKNVALQGLACGGLYIAGGIAAKNKNLFSEADFMHTFTRHAQHEKLLQKIPIFLIQDYQVSLYGGAHYYTLVTRGII